MRKATWRVDKTQTFIILARRGRASERERERFSEIIKKKQKVKRATVSAGGVSPTGSKHRAKSTQRPHSLKEQTSINVWNSVDRQHCVQLKSSSEAAEWPTGCKQTEVEETLAP